MYKSDGAKVWEEIDTFNAFLEAKAHDDYIKQNVIDNGKKTITLLLHSDIIDNITKKYIKDL